MDKLNTNEKRILSKILQETAQEDGWESYEPVISEIMDKLVYVQIEFTFKMEYMIYLPKDLKRLSQKWW